MPRSRELSGVDRDFFALVSRAAFANPFGEERLDLDRRLGAGPRGAPPAEITSRMVAAVAARVEGLGAARLDDFASADREALRIAFLFDAFHRSTEALDASIQEQIREPAEPVRIAWASDVLAQLARRGLGEAEAVRFFGLFFQLRRAFWFISNSLVGTSASMRALRERLWRNVFTGDVILYERWLWDRMEDFSTLLLGETGTGKGAAAAALGRSGWIPFEPKKRTFAVSFMETFLSINLSQFPESLIESELFGHRKGAFTGAVDDHHGVFDRVSAHGAIFLDEIGEVGVPVQIKLLRTLQERVFQPVGSHDTRRFHGRVVAATNRSIEDARRRGAFRDDFYYRLSSDVVVVPPLRARLAEDPGELDVLLEHVVARMIGRPAPELVRLARESIDRRPGPGYAWPGNVRELEQCVRRILIAGEYEGDAAAAASEEEALAEGIRGGTLDAREVLSIYCRILHRRLGTYEEVGRRLGLDRRTVKKYLRPAES